MIIPAKYFLTPKIIGLLQSIENSRAIIDAAILPPEIESNIRRAATLKSSLFSARIEGNSLTLADLSKTPSRDQKKVEVQNILKALEKTQNRGIKRDLKLKEILELHTLVMNSLLAKEELGRFRKDIGAIFNSAGIAIYLPPRPSQVLPLLTKLVSFINSSKEPTVPLKAALAHYSFEKIHPFLDGNGRVGRLLLQLVLDKGGYGMKGLINLEEYIDSHRTFYYQTLENSEKDVTDFIEFILEAINYGASEAKKLIEEAKQPNLEDYLLPRRTEILNIIKDHRLVDFDVLRRRFLSVNERTLRYDLKKLQEMGFIKKRGTTKGVYYEPR